MERALIGKLVENDNAFPNPPAGSTKRDLMPQFDKSAHGQDGAVAQMVNHLGGAGAQNESKQINKNMEKTVKLNENTLRQIVAESVKKVLNEHVWASAPTFKELQIVLNKVIGILSKFSDGIPQEQSEEFMKLAGREWNDLWESLSSLEETVMRINNPRGLSDSDLTFDDLS